MHPTDPRKTIGHNLAQAVESTLSLAPPTIAVDFSTILAGTRTYRNFVESKTTLMEDKIMKYAFVRFEEDHGEEHGVSTCANFVSGEAAENPEAFIKWHESGAPVKILYWFEVPECWDNAVAWGNVNDTLMGIHALDALGETPVVSDLLATIFDAGYELAQKKERNLATALRALLEC